MKFRAMIELGGKTATGIRIPPKMVEALGTSKWPAVRVTINGYTYHGTVAVMGGEFMLGVSAEVREKAGVAAGDLVDVDLELDLDLDLDLDAQHREVTAPPDLAKALKTEPDAKLTFEGLSFLWGSFVFFSDPDGNKWAVQEIPGRD